MKMAGTAEESDGHEVAMKNTVHEREAERSEEHGQEDVNSLLRVLGADLDDSSSH